MPHPRLRAAALLMSACGAAAAGGEPPALALRLEPRLSESVAQQVEGRPLYGSADRLVARQERDLTLSGNAELRRAGTVVRGDRITWHESDDEIVAVGNVRVVRQGNVFAGPALQLRMDGSAGVFLSPSFALGLYGGRGRADRIEFLGDRRVAMREASYTTCQADDPDWYLRTRSLEIDEAGEAARGEGATLHFKGRQILAAPLFAFSARRPPTSTVISGMVRFSVLARSTSSSGGDRRLPGP